MNSISNYEKYWIKPSEKDGRIEKNYQKLGEKYINY